MPYNMLERIHPHKTTQTDIQFLIDKSHIATIITRPDGRDDVYFVTSTTVETM